MQEDSRQSPAGSPGGGLFRRRVVFELTAEELPALQAAEARHGSKRAALIAALDAEARIGELERQAAQAQAALAKDGKRRQSAEAKQDKATAKREAKLETVMRALAKAERQLADAKAQASQQHAQSADDQQLLQERLQARDEQIDELVEESQRAVDELFCARCNQWAPPQEWAWKRNSGGGRYAHHKPCGDHAPGLLGASSWLAFRS